MKEEKEGNQSHKKMPRRGREIKLLLPEGQEEGISQKKRKERISKKKLRKAAYEDA